MSSKETASLYFHQTVQRNTDSNTRIDGEINKNKLTEQRKLFRNHGARKEFLKMTQSSNFDVIYDDIDREWKATKQKNEKIKEQLKQKKGDQRKHRKNSEKMIAEIFQIKQEIERKKIDLQRLSTESTALQNKQQKHLNDITNNNKYHIQRLITEQSCKNIIGQQSQTLQSLNNETNDYKSIIQQHTEINHKLSKQSDVLSKKCETYQDMLTMRNNDNTNNNHDNKELIMFQQNLESIKRLSSIKKLRISSNELCIQFESTSNEIYTIQIQMEPFQCNEHEISYSIQSAQITNNNNKYNEITDYVLKKYKKEHGNGDNEFINVPLMTLKSMVKEILLILQRLPSRYADITKLHETYKGKQDMIPWCPESDQLVFDFKFKQKVCIDTDQGGDVNDDDDQKMGDLGDKHGTEVMVTIDIPLVILISWEYPQHGFIRHDQVITIQGYNCNLAEKHLSINTTEMEQQWKDVLDETVNEVNGQFQNDIVGFVNFIHDRLKRFAETNQ